MKKIGKLRRGFLLMLCALCLVSACAVPAYAAGPTDTAGTDEADLAAACQTPVITYKYIGKFQLALIIYYDSNSGDTIEVNINGTNVPIKTTGSPALVDCYLAKDTGILVNATASNASGNSTATLVISGYGVPSPTLRVDTTSPGANKFSDVPFGSWYREDVNRLVKAGAIDGVSETRFAPEDPMTAAAYLKVLLAAMYREEMITTYYKDSGSAWYDPYFAFSALLPINEDGFVGVEDAEREISRYEMAVLLARAYKMYVRPNVYKSALDSANPGAIGDFDKIPEQYREAVLVCYYTKMLKGTDSAGTFSGDAPLTRCQSCSSVVRLFDAI